MYHLMPGNLIFCDKILWSIHSDNISTLRFIHLNMNSLEHKDYSRYFVLISFFVLNFLCRTKLV